MKSLRDLLDNDYALYFHWGFDYKSEYIYQNTLHYTLKICAITLLYYNKNTHAYSHFQHENNFVYSFIYSLSRDIHRFGKIE